jgi:hypothetical protein
MGSDENFTFLPLQFKDLKVDDIYEAVNKKRKADKLDELVINDMSSIELVPIINDWIVLNRSINHSFAYWYNVYNQPLGEVSYEELLKKLTQVGVDREEAPWNVGPKLDYKPPKNKPLAPSDVAVVVAEEEAKKDEVLKNRAAAAEGRKERKRVLEAAKEAARDAATAPQAEGKSPYVNIYFRRPFNVPLTPLMKYVFSFIYILHGTYTQPQLLKRRRRGDRKQGRF